MKGDFSTAALSAAPVPIASGWAFLCTLTASEIFASATAAQADGFYRALGTRIAALEPTDDLSALSELVPRVNKLWRALDFGEARMALDRDAILIHHYNMPLMLPDDPDRRWPMAAQALLAGAYDGWFGAMGSQPPLRTHVLSMTEAVIELRHGL